MNLKMSNKLNDFWDDCLDEKSLEFNFISNFRNPLSSLSSKTKQSTSTTINNEAISISSKKDLRANNSKNKQDNSNTSINISQKKVNLITKKFLEKWSPNIDNNKKKNKEYKNKLGRNKFFERLSKKSKSKSKSNNLSSEEMRLKKNLSECTFHPRISPIKNRNLQEKLLNYSKYSMYERGQIFQMKKKDDNQRMFRERNKIINIQYSFKPEIHKCPSFKKVLFNESNYDSLNYFYSRMNSARKNKINIKKKMPFNIVNYDELYKNKNEYFNMNLCHNNSKSNISNFLSKKNNKCFERSLSRNILIKKVLCKKNAEICKQNLHKILMELELNNI
jgi:hypothetical protein